MNIMDIVALYMFITLTTAVLFSFGFWIWMMVDCLKRKNLKNRTMWFLIVLLLNLMGAALYFWFVKSKKRG